MNETLVAEALAQWKATKTGPLTNPLPGNHLIYNRIPKNLVTTDPAAGKNSPHFELVPGVRLQICTEDV